MPRPLGEAAATPSSSSPPATRRIRRLARRRLSRRRPPCRTDRRRRASREQLGVKCLPHRQPVPSPVDLRVVRGPLLLAASPGLRRTRSLAAHVGEVRRGRPLSVGHRSHARVEFTQVGVLQGERGTVGGQSGEQQRARNRWLSRSAARLIGERRSWRRQPLRGGSCPRRRAARSTLTSASSCLRKIPARLLAKAHKGSCL